MKKFLIILLLAVWVYILFVKGYLTAGRYLLTHTPEILKSSSESRKDTLEPPFDDGEKFAFFYSMGLLRTGSAELTFVGKTTFEGKDAYLVRFKSRVGTFYDLENIYADTKTLRPIYIERNIRNLAINTNIKERYDQKNYKVEITKQTFLGEKTEVIEKQNPIHNAILLIYYCRRLISSELEPGYEFEVVLPVDEFKVTLIRIEEIKVAAGTFEAYLFESEPERMRLWIAKDEKHTPLKMENLTSFGPSSIVLDRQH